MIYNEYAQVLETKNPATGNLFTPDDLNVISWEKYGTSMLQDAIFASEAWLAQSGNEDTAVKFLKASFKGWMYCRDNPEPCVDIVLKSDAKLPKGHQTWQLNEVNGIIWPAPNGIGITDEAAFNRTVEVATTGKILTKPVEGKAVAQRPRREGACRADRHGHQGRVVAEGHRHPDRGRQVTAGLHRVSSREAGRPRRPASPLRQLPRSAPRPSVALAALIAVACGGSTPTASATPRADLASARGRVRHATPHPAPDRRLSLTPRPRPAPLDARRRVRGLCGGDRPGLLRVGRPRRDIGRGRSGRRAGGRRLAVATLRSSRSAGCHACSRRGPPATSDLVDIGQFFHRSSTLTMAFRDAADHGARGRSRTRRSASCPAGTDLEVTAAMAGRWRRPRARHHARRSRHGRRPAAHGRRRCRPGDDPRHLRAGPRGHRPADRAALSSRPTST